jgi:TRAP-type transport system small permease protein
MDTAFAKENNFIEAVRKVLQAIVTGFTWLNMGVLTFLILLIVANILSRALFRKPLLGTVELAELLTLVTVFLSLAYTEVRRGHVYVNLLTVKFPRVLKAAVAFIMSILAAVYFLSMSWESGVQGFYPLATTLSGLE